MRLRARATAIVCLLTALCIAGAIISVEDQDAFIASATSQTTDDAYVRADLVTIDSHIAGYIDTVPVQDNQMVVAGQTVATIRDDDYRARLIAADAELQAAQSAVDVLTEQATLQNDQITAAEASVREAEADLTQSRLERARQQSLVADGTTSRRDLEGAEAAQARLVAVRDHAVAELAASRQTLSVIQRQIAQAQQVVTAKKAARDLARIDLGYTSIVSPVTGQLSTRMALPGSYVAPGTQVNLVVPLSHVWVVANFREVQLAHMRIGQAVRLTVDSVPDVTFRGVVNSLGPVSGALLALLPPDNATGNFTKVAQRFPVKIVLTPGQGEVDLLRPGMSVTATVVTAPSVPEGEQ